MLPLRSLTRPSSPVQADNHPQIGSGHDVVSPPPRAHSFSHLSQRDMGHPKPRSHLEIILDSQHIVLKGTGLDVEPSRLSGHVVLYLAEDMPLKELTLQFRGKARIPSSPTESLMASNTTLVTNVIYNHEWSFLEGDKNHVHTVKAGRHVFPFHLEIDGSFPSSLSTYVLGGSSIYYKLRAVAVRTGFNYNISTTTPVFIDRAFSHEALEYQQSVEIENTWADKIMYSATIPHKAWAAGDQVVAILKLSPLTKGVFVSQIRTLLQETTKVYARSGAQENTRTAACARHNIIDGKPVFVNPRLSSSTQPQTPVAGPSTATTPSEASSSRGSFIGAPPRRSLSSPQISPMDFHTPWIGLEQPQPGDNNDIVVTIALKIPLYSVTPSHSLEPMVVTHRLRWSITLRNLSGYTSELRCSLPIHILHYRVLEEARSFTAATRRLFLGSSELPTEEEEDRELPSYDAHLRDRVANMFFPDTATVRVNNPFNNRSVPHSPHQSGYSTPMEPHTLSHLPHAPGPEGTATLNLLNSELLLSLSDSPLQREPFTPEAYTPSDQTSRDSSQPQSRNRSRPHSRHNSRPSSPDGSHHQDGHHDGGATHHGHGHSRDFRGIFRATMRPFTAISHNPSRFLRSGNHSAPDNHEVQSSQTTPSDQQEQSPVHPVAATGLDHVDGAELLHRALTEVPDYSVASRGFIGGVPPLESMRGLPSYEEAARDVAQRTQSSDGDLAAGISGISLGDGSASQREGRVSH